MIAPLLPDLARDLSVSLASAGQLVTVFALTYALRVAVAWAQAASSRWRVSLIRRTQTLPSSTSISLRQQGLCSIRQ